MTKPKPLGDTGTLGDIDLSTPTRALASALLLGLTAPTDEDADRVSAIAEDIAATMDHDDVAAAKALALDMLADVTRKLNGDAGTLGDNHQ